MGVCQEGWWRESVKWGWWLGGGARCDQWSLSSGAGGHHLHVSGHHSLSGGHYAHRDGVSLTGLQTVSLCCLLGLHNAGDVEAGDSRRG